MSHPSNIAPDPRQPFKFERIAVLAMSQLARVELCRIVEGEPADAVVAVKRLPLHYSEEDGLLDMFRDEIWLASSLSHPNVTRVLGWGEDDGGPYLVAEFVRGVSLARLMRTVFSTGEAFTERLIVYLAARVCDGLAAAHDLRSADGDLVNLVHRDLTPGNILLGFEGDVKITDFGLAKAKQRVTHTAVGVTKGNPAYMAPEQIMGRDIDGRADLFALGVMLFELFAQRPPWVVKGVRDALNKIVNGEPTSLAIACPRIDRNLVGLVERLMAKKADDRYQTAKEVRDALDHWLHLHGYDDNLKTFARFVRRNAMRQMHWVDRAVAGQLEANARGPTPLQLSREEMASKATPAPSVPTPSRAAAPTRAEAPISPPVPSDASGPTGTPAPDLAESSSSQPSLESVPATVLPEDGPSQLSAVMATAPEVADKQDKPLERRGRHASATITAVATGRSRDASPPVGATDAQMLMARAAADARAAQSTADAPSDHDSSPRTAESEPSTLRRGEPSQEDLVAASQGIMAGAADIVSKAQSAAENARAAADEAQQAARAAQQLAGHAERAAEAARLATEALSAAAAGDMARSFETLQHARELLDDSG